MQHVAPETQTSPPTAASPAGKSAAQLASRAIWVAISATALAAVIGFFAFTGRLTPLSGGYSVGTITGLTSGVIAGIAALIGLSVAAGPRVGSLVWMRRRSWIWWFIDSLGLFILHGAITTMAALSIFRLFQQAFQGLVVDAIAATVMLCIASAGAAYFGFNAAVRASASSISTLLALFMAAGMLASMLLAENPYWWHQFFSELGTGQAGVLSFWTFNTTLTVSGLVLVTLANFISQDLTVWATHRQRLGKRRAVPWVLRGGMIIMGLCMVGLSWVPININDPLHTGFVQVLAVTFGLMLLSVPLWLPGAPAATYVMSYLMLVLGVLAVGLWAPVGYYNLTALELAFAGIIFAWLVVLIRTLDAMIADAARPSPAPVAASAEGE